MKKYFLIAITLTFLIPISNAFTGELKTVTLEVDGMTCSMCPITVKRAIKQLDGVSNVSAKYEGKGNGWTRVTFDTAKLNIEDLTLATKEAGFPSRQIPQ